MKSLFPLILSGMALTAAQMPAYAAPHFKTMDDVYRYVVDGSNVHNWDEVLATVAKQCPIRAKINDDLGYWNKCHFGNATTYIGGSNTKDFAIELITDMSQFNKLLAISTQINGQPGRNAKYSYSWGDFRYYAKLEIDEVNPKLLHFYMKQN